MNDFDFKQYTFEQDHQNFPLGKSESMALNSCCKTSL